MFWCCPGMNLTYILFTTETKCNVIKQNSTCGLWPTSFKPEINSNCLLLVFSSSVRLCFCIEEKILIRNALWDVQLSLLSTKSLQDFFCKQMMLHIMHKVFSIECSECITLHHFLTNPQGQIWQLGYQRRACAALKDKYCITSYPVKVPHTPENWSHKELADWQDCGRLVRHTLGSIPSMMKRMRMEHTLVCWWQWQWIPMKPEAFWRKMEWDLRESAAAV